MVPYPDRLNGTFIGKGEIPVKEFLRDYFNLHEYSKYNFHRLKEGLYTQIPIPMLLNKDELRDIAEPHYNSSVDIVLVLDFDGDKLIVAVRVQGSGHSRGPKKGRGYKSEGKSKFDRVQEDMLFRSGIMVINIHHYECPHLFKKDSLDSISRREIKDSFKYRFPL